MKVSLFQIADYTKTGKWVSSRKRDNDSNSEYVQNWKTPDIVLKTAKGLNIFLKSFRSGMDCCPRHVQKKCW